MFRWIVRWTVCFVLCAVIFTVSDIPSRASTSPEWVINGEAYTFESEPIMKDQRWSLPLREIVDALGADFEWDQDQKQVTILSPNDDRFTMELGTYITIFNDEKYISDSTPFLQNQRIYYSLRHVAELMHMNIQVDQESNTIYLNQVAPYVVKKGDTWQSISEELGVELSLLKDRNPSFGSALYVGDEIKWVIPSMMSDELVNPNVNLLAKLIQVEAGYESYEGQLAVGNVVVNRVDDPRFPDTIYDVIYAKGQFPPALNGTLDTIEPSENSLKAAREALLGVTVAEDALYFYNPDVSSSPFFRSLELVVEIGNHRFVK